MIVCIYGEIWFNREIENKNLLIDTATPIKEVEKVTVIIILTNCLTEDFIRNVLNK